MAKEAKIKQTDWTTGGRDISNKAIPYYQEGLDQLHDYTKNVQNRLDPYIEKYINPASAAEQSDFMRNYQRAMGQQTAQNYAATGGGYSSANQLGYDDLQRYYNDYASRLYSQGLTAANQLANNEYDILQGSLGAYGNAYRLGENYSNIDQYNDMVDQANSNAWTGWMNTLGDVGLSSGNPYAMAAGAALKGVGTAFGKDFSAMDSLRARATGTVANSGQYSNSANNQTGLSKGLTNTLGQFDWFKNNPFGSNLSGGTVKAGNASGVAGAMKGIG